MRDRLDAPGCDVCEASQLFSDDLLEDVPIERQVGDDLLQLGILMAQRPGLAQLLQAEAGELLLPAMERLFTHPESAEDFGRLSRRLRPDAGRG